MRTKSLLFIALGMVWILNACSPFTITSSSGEQPTPEVESTPAPVYQPVDVDQVEVEVGVGSPIPVQVTVSGNLPDTCAQIELVQQRQVGSNFQIMVSSVPSIAEECVQDTLPFRIVLPLNTVNLPAGSYSVDVNGSSASFELDTGNTTSSQPTADSAITKDEIQVTSLDVEVSVGSPLPVHAIVGLNLPNRCAQLGEIRLHREGTTFFVRLIADIAEREDCQADSIPFLAEIPLNIVNLPEGPYEVNVNGVTDSFDPRATPASPSTAPFQLTYIGRDGNVWFHPGFGLEPRQLTTDASGSDGGAGITYYFPKISGDGQWVAYRRDVATAIESGLEYTFGLWVHNLTTGESQQILEKTPAGFAWKPGTHLLAYGLGVPEGYFSFGSENPVDSSLARGVMAFDADTGERSELVRPERGYALYSLQWSPDGRFLSFDELVYIEGRGPFAYYDFEAGSYVAWEEPIGNYAWSPDSTRIFYDRMIYVANGMEEIFVRSMPEGDEERLTDYGSETEYAFSPALSPRGDRFAYLVGSNDPGQPNYTLYVRDFAGDKPTPLGTFNTALNLDWSPDGEWLVFSAGPWEGQQLIAVHVLDGSVTELGPGTTPDVADAK